jgi:hypothetical protein
MKTKSSSTNSKRSSSNTSKIKRGGTKAKVGSSRLGKKRPGKTGKIKKTSSIGPKKRAQNTIKKVKKITKSRKNKSVAAAAAGSADKTSRAKNLTEQQVEQDELLQQARANLIAKLNAMDSKKRQILQNEQEKAQLVSALIAQNDGKTDTQPPTINVINAPAATLDDTEQKAIECNPDDDVFLLENLGAAGLPPTVKSKSIAYYDIEDSPDLKSKAKKRPSSTSNFDEDDFQSPLTSKKRFSVHENLYNKEKMTEQTMFDTPEAKKLIKAAVSNTSGLVKQYLSKLNIPAERKYFDSSSTGLKIVDDSFRLGHLEVVFQNDFFKVDGMMQPATAGVLELLFYKQPDRKLVTPADLEVYKQILISSSAHLKFDANQEVVPSSRSKKYRDFIEPLFARKVQGSGTTYIHWVDPNELVER